MLCSQCSFPFDCCTTITPQMCQCDKTISFCCSKVKTRIVNTDRQVLINWCYSMWHWYDGCRLHISRQSFYEFVNYLQNNNNKNLDRLRGKLQTPTLMWVCSTSWNHSYNNASQQETPLHPSCPEDHWPSLAPPNHWACYTAEGSRKTVCVFVFMHVCQRWVQDLQVSRWGK